MHFISKFIIGKHRLLNLLVTLYSSQICTHFTGHNLGAPWPHLYYSLQDTYFLFCAKSFNYGGDCAKQTTFLCTIPELFKAKSTYKIIDTTYLQDINYINKIMAQHKKFFKLLFIRDVVYDIRVNPLVANYYHIKQVFLSLFYTCVLKNEYNFFQYWSLSNSSTLGNCKSCRK